MPSLPKGMQVTSYHGEGGTPYNGLYGKAPSERGSFFKLQV